MAETASASLVGLQCCGPDISPIWRPFRPFSGQAGSGSIIFSQERGVKMDTNTIIRVVAGVLFLVVLAIFIQRRRTKVK
jgi:hypothetical protein